MQEGIEDHHPVRDSYHNSAQTQPGEDEQRLPCCPDHARQHEEECDRLDQVGPVDAKRGTMVRCNHDVDGARNQEDRRGNRERRAQIGHCTRTPALDRKSRDCERNSVLEDGRRIKADLPAHRVRGSERAGQRGECQRDWKRRDAQPCPERARWPRHRRGRRHARHLSGSEAG